MRRGMSVAHRESRVQQQHALFGPTREIAVAGRSESDVVLTFGEDVPQRRRGWLRSHHGERKTVGLADTVVRILSEDDDSRALQRSQVKCGEFEMLVRVHDVSGTLRVHKVPQVAKVRLTGVLRDEVEPLVEHIEKRTSELLGVMSNNTQRSTFCHESYEL